MRLVIGLLAASLVGVEGPKTPDDPTITYDLKILEMHGVDWRATSYAQLQPVARQGAVTVWTAPREAAAALTVKAHRIEAAPRVSAFDQARATITRNSTRHVVTQINRRADGPVNHASFVGYTPKVEKTTEGWTVKVRGRKVDQGVLAHVTLEDVQVTAVHKVALREVLEPGAGRDPGSPIEADLQVPEFARAEAGGEWLIPADGVLVVSFGAHTVADDAGKAVVRERLALLEARPVEAGAPAQNLAPFKVALPFTPAGAEPAAAGPDLPRFPAPATPSRSYPVSGSAARREPLPPLPDDHVTPTSLPGSSEPCASPQTRTTAATATAARCERSCCDDAPAASPVAAKGWTPVPGKPFSFRLPVRDGLVIEVRATAAPSASASAPPPPALKDLKRD